MVIVLVLSFKRDVLAIASLRISTRFTSLTSNLYNFFYGLDWIATVPPTISIARKTFGTNKSGVIYGWIFASHQAGAALAAYGGGLIYKFFNSYTWAFFPGRCFLCFSKLICYYGKKNSHKGKLNLNNIEKK